MFEKNMLALKEYYNDLYTEIVNYKEEKYISVQSKNGMPNLLLQDSKYLHSQYNPYNEVLTWINGFKLGEEDTIFIIGLGLGHYMKALTEKYSEKKLIIIEPDLEIFKNALKTYDFCKYISDENIVFLVNMDAYSVEHLVGHYLYTNKIKKIYFAEVPIYKKIRSEYIAEVYNYISKLTLSLKGNLITELAFGQMWLENTIKNLPSLMEYSNINELKGMCSDTPVVIVSAGPSLEKNIPLLKKILDKCLIVGVGSSANILEHNGITPHLVFAVDGNVTEAHIFDKLKTTESILVFSPSVHYNVIEKYKGPKLWTKLNSDNYMDFVLNELDINTVSLASGASVANITLDFCNRWLSAKTILFIGQDLAYSSGKLYAAGNVHNDKSHKDFEGNPRYRKTVDIYGDVTYTSENFLVMKGWFEDYISVFKKNEGVYNCTEGGLDIKGIPNMKFEDAINEFCTVKVDTLSKILNIANKKPQIDIVNHETLISKCREQCEKCVRLSKERLGKCEEIVDKYNVPNDFNIVLNDILKIGEELEEIEFYKYFIMLTGERYINAITTSTNNEIERIEDKLEQKRAVMNGLIRQYLYIHQCLETAQGAFNQL